MLMRIHAGLREISASTTMVDTYGSMLSYWLATCTPVACKWNCNMVTPPNR